jgi:hypothetical protein
MDPSAQPTDPVNVAVKLASEFGAMVALPSIVPFTLAVVPAVSGVTENVMVPAIGILKPAMIDAECCPDMLPT